MGKVSQLESMVKVLQEDLRKVSCSSFRIFFTQHAHEQSKRQ